MKGDQRVMKKVKLLIASVVCAVMLMGVGYAAWNQSIHVKTFAKAGELKVRLVNEDEGKWQITKKDSVAEWQVTGNDGKTLTLSFNKLYPGAKAALSGSVENNGNLPAKFSKFIVSGFKGNKTNESQSYPDLFYYLKASTTNKDDSFIPFNEFINEKMSAVRIPAGNSISVGPIYFMLDENAPSSLQGKWLEFSVEFVFELDVNNPIQGQLDQ
jgi:hypothetical protein